MPAGNDESRAAAASPTGDQVAEPLSVLWRIRLFGWALHFSGKFRKPPQRADHVSQRTTSGTRANPPPTAEGRTLVKRQPANCALLDLALDGDDDDDDDEGHTWRGMSLCKL